MDADPATGATRWYLAHRALNLNISSAPQAVSLGGGWACVVGPTSVNEARQTLCRNENHSVEFSVQCSSSQPNDHTQIRFKDGAGLTVDFIEVGCKLRE